MTTENENDNNNVNKNYQNLEANAKFEPSPNRTLPRRFETPPWHNLKLHNGHNKTSKNGRSQPQELALQRLHELLYCVDFPLSH